MSAYDEKFIVQNPLETVAAACQMAVAEIGWKVLTQDRTRTVIREVAMQDRGLTIPTQIEIKIRGLSQATGVEVHGSQIGFGAATTAHIHEQVSDVIARIYKHIDGIGTPAQQEQRRLEAEKQAQERRQAEMETARQLEAERREAEERAEAHRVARAQAQEQREAERRAALKAAQEMPPPPAPQAVSYTPPPAASSSGGGLAEELEKLARLREQGILTDEEFQHAKHKLLGL